MAMGRSAAWQAVLAGCKLMHTVIRAGKSILHGSPRIYNSTVVHVHGYPLPRLSNGAHWTTVGWPRLSTVVHVHGCPNPSGVHRPALPPGRQSLCTHTPHHSTTHTHTHIHDHTHTHTHTPADTHTHRHTYRARLVGAPDCTQRRTATISAGGRAPRPWCALHGDRGAGCTARTAGPLRRDAGPSPRPASAGPRCLLSPCRRCARAAGLLRVEWEGQGVR